MGLLASAIKLGVDSYFKDRELSQDYSISDKNRANAQEVAKIQAAGNVESSKWNALGGASRGLFGDLLKGVGAYTLIGSGVKALKDKFNNHGPGASGGSGSVASTLEKWKDEYYAEKRKEKDRSNPIERLGRKVFEQVDTELQWLGEPKNVKRMENAAWDVLETLAIGRRLPVPVH